MSVLQDHSHLINTRPAIQDRYVVIAPSQDGQAPAFKAHRYSIALGFCMELGWDPETSIYQKISVSEGEFSDQAEDGEIGRKAALSHLGK